MTTQDQGVWKQCPCGRATDCQKDHGSWSFRVYTGKDPASGRRRRIERSGFPKKSDALKERNKILGRIAEGKIAHDAGWTFGDYLDHWYNSLKRRPEPPEHKTMVMHQTNIRVWKNESGLAEIRLGKLTKRDFNDAFSHLGRVRSESERPTGMHGRWTSQRSLSTLRRYKATATAALSEAVDDGLLGKNPAGGRMNSLKKRRGSDAAADRWLDSDPWNREQIRVFLEGTAGTDLGNLWRAYLYTGARRGEMLGAMTSAFNPNRTRLAVRHTAVPSTGMHDCAICSRKHNRVMLKETPKTSNSRRHLYLHSRLRVILEQQARSVAVARTQFEAAHGAGSFQDHGLLFPSPDGTPYDGDWIGDRFEEACQRLGLPLPAGSKLHFLRHTSASLLLSTGMSYEQVSLNLGDSVEVLRTRYAHLIEDANQEQIEAAYEGVMSATPTGDLPPAGEAMINIPGPQMDRTLSIMEGGAKIIPMRFRRSDGV